MFATSSNVSWLANSPHSVSPAAEGAAIAMLAVIFFLAFSIFAAAMVLRNRARSLPRPENELLDELNTEEHKDQKRSVKQAKPASKRQDEPEDRQDEWERDPDWWKK